VKAKGACPHFLAPFVLPFRVSEIGKVHKTYYRKQSRAIAANNLNKQLIMCKIIIIDNVPSFKVTHFGVSGKQTMDYIWLYNNVGLITESEGSED